MEYFFVDHQDIHGRTLVLRGEEYKHLSRVLRKRVGDQVFVTDGDDTMFEAVITLLDRNHAECDIVRTEMRANEPKVDVTLAVSLLKNPARFDFLVEKATELGVRTIIPILCERTVPRHEKHDRLEKIALAAMKQSGRCYRPRVFTLSTFEELADHAHDQSLRLIPHERTEQSQFIATVLEHHRKARSILIAIGPEGGFTESELDLASRAKFVPISLGPRRLRSETAAISAVTWVVAEW